MLPGVSALLSRQEVADICHVSIQTIDRMISAGQIKPTADGDILKADLIDYMLKTTLADVLVLEG